MQPTSHHSRGEYSPRNAAAHSTPSHSETRRVRSRRERPEKYEVPPAPRHVLPAVPPEDEAGKPFRRDRAKRRLRLKRRLTVWEWAGFVASCVACSFLLRAIIIAEGDFRHLRGQVHEKQGQLAALERQKSEEKNRLAHLKSREGREQLLAERGYLKPGTRILLFPNENAESENSE